MSQMRYTSDHEWVRVEGDAAVVGISNYAQEQLGDVVFVELPDIGTTFAQNDDAAVVESVKAATTALYSARVLRATSPRASRSRVWDRRQIAER